MVCYTTLHVVSKQNVSMVGRNPSCINFQWYITYVKTDYCEGTAGSQNWQTYTTIGVAAVGSTIVSPLDAPQVRSYRYVWYALAIFFFKTSAGEVWSRLHEQVHFGVILFRIRYWAPHATNSTNMPTIRTVAFLDIRNNDRSTVYGRKH